jgi:drug/metabolite transporter (DMT)-like permease
MTAALPQQTSQRATLLGLGAVVLWGLLAAFSTLCGSIPPFQLNAMTFAIGTLVGLAYARITGTPLVAPRDIPIGAWALGVYGLLAFHAAYFFAIQSAPVIEVSLIVYLWPLLIVVFSALLPQRLGGGALRWWQVAGALLGFAGVALILLGKAGRPEFSGAVIGYLAALAAALIWSSYSVASRLFHAVPSTAVTGFCAATAIGSALLHLAFERFVWPASAAAWLAILACGLGPVGLAFYIWDEGMKRGDMRLLGAASYATPLISTVVLAAAGLGMASPQIWFAALLITAGALLASADKFKRA